eukprot:COSAG02_NODE_17225_length_1020_cov_1.023887_1_plen_90_part_00
MQGVDKLVPHPRWKVTNNLLLVHNELIWVEMTVVRHQSLAHRVRQLFRLGKFLELDHLRAVFLRTHLILRKNGRPCASKCSKRGSDSPV